MCRLSSAVSSFNRSVAKSPSATIIRASALPPSAEFQSLSREKPFCHGGPRERASRPRRTACREFQSLSREKPFCHTGEADLVLADGKFQSLSREKPFCHDGSIALHWPKRAFQSLSREKPFCHFAAALRCCDESCTSFNRSVAKSPSATRAMQRQQRRSAHSFNRSVAKSPSATRPPQLLRWAEQGFNRSVAKSPSATLVISSTIATSSRFQSLSREKPFCHFALLTAAYAHIHPVSIAQSRKALLPHQ